MKLHTTQDTGLGSESKVDSTLSLTADSASYIKNSVNLVADPASHSANSVKLVADPAKSYCSSNTVSNTLTAVSAMHFPVTLIVALSMLMKIVTRII